MLRERNKPEAHDKDEESGEMVPLMSLEERRTGFKSLLLRLRSSVSWRYAVVCGLCLWLLILVVGMPFPNTKLPEMPPLPENPKRVSATMHSDSNPCYDMMLFVLLKSWLKTKPKYPMLVLHSVPLPEKVQQLVAANDNIIARDIPAVKNHFVMKERIQSSPTKLAVWAQADYDQLAYYDSDHIFFESGDGIFDAPDDGGNKLLYAAKYEKYWKVGKRFFNGGNFLIRPSKEMYSQIEDLFRRKFWIMNPHLFFKTADQGFLNAVFKDKWGFLDKQKLGRVKHVKFWLAVAGEERWGVTKQDQKEAQAMLTELKLEDEMEQCLHHRRYSE